MMSHRDSITNSETLKSYDQAKSAQLKMAVQSLSFWVYAGVGLSALFLTINTVQAYWALSQLSQLATDSTLNMAVTGMIAAGLIIAGNVVAVRLGDGSFSSAIGILILIALMGFSILTSAMHLGYQLIGGHEKSVQNSVAYQIALDDYNTASQAYKDVLKSAELADADGDPRSSGWIRSEYAPPLQQAAQDARKRLEVAGSTAGAEMSVLANVAGFVGVTPKAFSTGLALFAVAMMEIVRIWLSYKTVVAIRGMLAQRTHEDVSLGKSHPHLRAVS